MHAVWHNAGAAAMPQHRPLGGRRIDNVHARRRPAATSVASTDRQALSVDVVIVGAGIIGLLTAHTLLRASPRCSVLVVERRQLCAGATGAGQGYIWMAHRSPGTPGWGLAAASTALWREAVKGDALLSQAIEWQGTGSLLLGQTAAEAAALEDRAGVLREAGLPGAQLLDHHQLQQLEPALSLPPGAAGLLLPSDAQINGRLTAATLLGMCHGHAPRFQMLMDSPVERLLCQAASGEAGCHVVETARHRVVGRLATIITAGVWTGALLAAATGDTHWATLFVPRRGHLLELPRPDNMAPIKTGMMELSYSKHYSSAGVPAPLAPGIPAVRAAPDITFTATTSASGNLLVGSSREDGRMEQEPCPEVVSAIMARAAEFLPALAGETAPGVRVGPRPFAAGGLPVIGPVPGQPGMYVAAGHEGSGLCMGPATARLVAQAVVPAASLPKQPLPLLSAITAQDFDPAARLAILINGAQP